MQTLIFCHSYDYDDVSLQHAFTIIDNTYVFICKMVGKCGMPLIAAMKSGIIKGGPILTQYVQLKTYCQQ